MFKLCHYIFNAVYSFFGTIHNHTLMFKECLEYLITVLTHRLFH